MGNCAPIPHNSKISSWPETSKIIFENGQLLEIGEPVSAKQILFRNPNLFLCNSDNMHVDSHVPIMEEDEKLQLGQIYFLLPFSKSRQRLSLPELCSLAATASSALLEHGKENMGYFSGEHRVCFPSRRRRDSRIWMSFAADDFEAR